MSVGSSRTSFVPDFEASALLKAQGADLTSTGVGPAVKLPVVDQHDQGGLLGAALPEDTVAVYRVLAIVLGTGITLSVQGSTDVSMSNPVQLGAVDPKATGEYVVGISREIINALGLTHVQAKATLGGGAVLNYIGSLHNGRGHH